jgi:type VI secretion system protein ImpA
MALDLDRLLAPVSEDEPAGPDLAYDNERAEIEQAFEIDISIDASGVESEAQDVDWRSVVNKIVSQSERTKDIWLAVYLTRAGALSGQLELVETGAQYLAGLLEQYWPSVHPQLEEYGFQGRKGACDSLTGSAQFVNPLRRIKLLTHPRLGEYSGLDFERFNAGGDSEDGYGMFRAALDDVGADGLNEIAGKLDVITAAIKRADAVLTANAEGGGATNFQPTYDALAQLRRAVMAFGPEPMEPEAAPEQVQAGGGDDGGGSGGPRIAGRVESREDVIRALDAIGDYYRRKEPSHPIPSLLQRAREWVGMDFIAILEDIVPSGIGEARTILQSRKAREEAEGGY